MVAYGEVRRWSAGPVHRTEDALKSQSDRLLRLADELDMAGRTPTWYGSAGQAAQEQHVKLCDDLEDVVAQLAAVRSAMGEAGDSIETLMFEVAETDELARHHHFSIDDSGAVHDNASTGAPNPGGGPGLAQRQLIRNELTDRVEWTLRRAGAIDEAVLSVLNATRTSAIEATGTGDGGAASGLTEADEQGVDQALREIYQVSPDPDGMTEYPGGLAGWLWDALRDQQEVTAGEARMLTDLGPLGGNEVRSIRQDATHQAENVFGGEGITDGHADAFRHAYANARMTQRFGEEWTAEFTTAHERNPSSNATPVAMDLHNNEVGRRIAVANPDASPEELRELVEQAVRDGELVVVDQDEQLRYSNEVPIGETRPDKLVWPTSPERKEHRDPT